MTPSHFFFSSFTPLQYVNILLFPSSLRFLHVSKNSLLFSATGLHIGKTLTNRMINTFFSSITSLSSAIHIQPHMNRKATFMVIDRQLNNTRYTCLNIISTGGETKHNNHRHIKSAYIVGHNHVIFLPSKIGSSKTCIDTCFMYVR